MIFEELAQELAELVERNLARFVVVQHGEDDLVALAQVLVVITIAVNTPEQALDESLNLFLFQGSRVISVDSIEY